MALAASMPIGSPSDTSAEPGDDRPGMSSSSSELPLSSGQPPRSSVRCLRPVSCCSAGASCQRIALMCVPARPILSAVARVRAASAAHARPALLSRLSSWHTVLARLVALSSCSGVCSTQLSMPGSAASTAATRLDHCRCGSGWPRACALTSNLMLRRSVSAGSSVGSSWQTTPLLKSTSRPGTGAVGVAGSKRRRAARKASHLGSRVSEGLVACQHAVVG
jgi:hypothetical protein